MKIIDIKDVEDDFDLLINQAAEGHSFIISIDGKPLVQVTPARGKRASSEKSIVSELTST